MNQKIEWYREVLELEPGSRVFFPLARLLAEESDFAGAIGVLETGMLRHPDHIEARLLLVELLSGHGSGEALQAELATLAKLFGKYPSFWKIWSAGMAVNPGMQDAALAMSFLGAALDGRPVTWASVIARGLEAVLGEAMPAPISAPMHSVAPVACAAPTLAPQSSSVTPAVPPVIDRSSHAAPVGQVASELQGVADQASTATRFDGMKPGEMEISPTGISLVTGTSFSEDEQEEPFTLRTRSMADVLAEQGDTSGALEIYSELLASASAEARVALQQRIDSLSSLGFSVAPAPEDSSPEESVEGERMVSLLEALAQRFEARAR